LKPNQLSGGLVSAVEPCTLADQMGLRPGDEILAVNDYPLRDVIDFRFYAAEEEIDLLVRRDGSQFALTGARRYDQPVGVEFAHPTFDVDIRRCNNKCEFCFVTQSPRGMRRTVYIKDDDYRYSFLYGHFVTLTNLGDEDWERIEEQHLSPLYVSVHATELELRRKLLVKKDAPDVLAQIRWLGERGIEVHTQLVLIPEVNDGPHLERSLRDLTDLFPSVQSVSVVPIGLTRYHPGHLRTYRHEEAAPVLDQVEPWRESCRREFGTTLVYPSDEWYLLAERPVPPAVEYDGFGQLENGVGMVRQFLDEWRDIKSQTLALRRPARRHGRAGARVSNLEAPISSLRGERATLVCGELAAPVLRQMADELNELTGSQVRVAPIVNNWYGVVTVSGLLTGRDVITQLTSGNRMPLPGEMVLLPRVMFDNSGQVTLDDMTPAQLQEALGTPVGVAQSPGELLATLRGELSPQDVLAPKPDWWGEGTHPILFPVEV
jgi:putative radical SAM enzyme (TIGR03279 family)